MSAAGLPPTARPGGRGWLALAAWAAPLVFLGLFFFYPLGAILSESFSRAAGGAGGAFAATLGSPSIWRVIGFTFGQAALSTLLTLLFGLPGAYLLARYRFPGKSLLRALTGIPFVMPTLVVAAAFSALLGPRGWLNQALMGWFGLSQPPLVFMQTFTAILTAHVFYNTTIVLRLVGDFWGRLDPRLEQAAQALGANRAQTWLRVTLPLLAPAVSAAGLLVFIFNFSSFGVVLLLGGPRFATLEVEIFYQVTGLFNLPVAAVLALIQLAFTLALSAAYTMLTARLAPRLRLRSPAAAQRPLAGLRRRLLAGLWVTLALALLVAPLAALALRAFTRLEPGGWAWTLDYFAELSVNRRASLFYAPPAASILVSLGYAGMTVVLALLLGLPAAWALGRQSLAASRLARTLGGWLDALLMLPLGTSPVTLGLGFILALGHPPLDLRASPLLIPLAHTLAAFPFVVRSLTPALRSLHPRLRQAAAVLGASPWQAWRRVELPLLARPLLAAATFAFTISLGEFGATALIARPEYPTLPLAIFRFLGQPGALNYGQGLALSVILMAVCAAGMLLIERLRLPGDEGEALF